MAESNNNSEINSELLVNRDANETHSRSYLAMVLSLFLPGLGQLYLGQYLKAFAILLVFATAIGLFYLNSYPVNEWSDLWGFISESEDSNSSNSGAENGSKSEGSIHLWTLDSGKELKFRPSWKLKITSSIQGLLCWIYAVYGGWKGRYRIT